MGHSYTNIKYSSDFHPEFHGTASICQGFRGSSV